MLLLASLLATITLPAGAQELRYRLPPDEVVALVDAPAPPSFSVSPDARWILVQDSPPLPDIADVSRPLLRLAGIRIDPTANGPHRTRFSRTLTLRDLHGRKKLPVTLPENGRLATVSWSHTSRSFALAVVTGEGTSLYLVSVDEPETPALITSRLNSVLGSGFTWHPDGTGIFYLEVPADRSAAPAAPVVPTGPSIQETSGRKSPLRTYQDLLTGPHDEALFRHYATSNVMFYSMYRASMKVGGPDLHTGLAPSPDGTRLLVTRILEPFSYLTPWWSFPRSIEIWDLPNAKARHIFARLPQDEGVPIGGVRTGPRSIGWRAGVHADLVWVEALDGGDPKQQVVHRDRWMHQTAPFDQPASELLLVEQRARTLLWLDGGKQVFASEYDRDRRWVRTTLVDLSGDGEAARVVEDRSMRDRYAHPGSLLTSRNRTGSTIVRRSGPWVYRTGSGASEKGDLPFLDRLNLDTLETERLWRCAEGSYESVLAIVSDPAEARPTLVTRRETPSEPPNYHFRDLEQPAASYPLSRYQDPMPQIRGVKKELITYQRDDGVKLSATLYLPADHRPGTRLPLLVWAYPREFNDPRTAGQISGSAHRFTRFRGASHLYLLTQGYAIMDAATMPVIGDPETMNDTFLPQIVAAAQAAIDAAAKRGVADPSRVGVGGHSYGAFMTANLLAHCDLFRAGVARSGAYNRTLTPFGFQSERRTVWQAPEAYFRISPFMHADKINEPLLLIHGERDNNSGTFPMQSKRMFSAIKGNGGTARLVFLPNESHGYAARESVLHTLAEMIDWFDVHVKNARRLE